MPEPLQYERNIPEALRLLGVVVNNCVFRGEERSAKQLSTVVELITGLPAQGYREITSLAHAWRMAHTYDTSQDPELLQADLVNTRANYEQAVEEINELNRMIKNMENQAARQRRVASSPTPAAVPLEWDDDAPSYLRTMEVAGHAPTPRSMRTVSYEELLNMGTATIPQGVVSSATLRVAQQAAELRRMEQEQDARISAMWNNDPVVLSGATRR